MQILMYFVYDGSYCMVPTQPPPHPLWERLQELSPDRPGQMCAETCFFFFPLFFRKEEREKRVGKKEKGNASKNVFCTKQNTIKGVPLDLEQPHACKARKA